MVPRSSPVKGFKALSLWGAINGKSYRARIFYVLGRSVQRNSLEIVTQCSCNWRVAFHFPRPPNNHSQQDFGYPNYTYSKI